MKPSLFYSSILVTLFLTPPLAAQIIVEDTNIVLQQLAPDFAALRIYQDPNQSCRTSIWFSIDSGSTPNTLSLTFEDLNLDEGSDWYLTNENDVFSEQSIANGTHTIWGGFEPNGDPITGNSIDVSIGEFFLGVATDAVFDSEVGRNTYGWAKLSIDANMNLTLLDNAVAYETDRIIIGQNAVPEPSVLVFIGGGAFACSLIRRRS